MRTVFSLLTAILVMLNSSIATGVTPVNSDFKARSCDDTVTTKPAARAQTEVQVRRLHSLLVSKQADDDAVDQYRRLQQRLRAVK